MIEPIFDDGTPNNALVPPGFSSGYKGMYSASMVAADISTPFPAGLLIPEHEWQARIEEMEERKSRVSDLLKQGGVPVLNQQSTNFCWCFAPVAITMIQRAIQNQPMVHLSPASVACPITKFKNNGGYGGDALEYLIEKGVVPSGMWPDTAIDRKYMTDAAALAALDYRVTEWWSLRSRNIQEQISCLLRRIPVSSGLSYWGHQVADVDAVWVNGKIGVRFLNSWGAEWGAAGYGIRQGNKMPGDDMTCIRQAVAS